MAFGGNPWTAEKGTTPWIGAQWWMEKHDGFLNETQQHGKDIKAVFLGDSITDNWRWIGLSVWNAHYANRGAVNYGLSGDQVQNVLWRVEHGEFDKIEPKVVVLMIGKQN